MYFIGYLFGVYAYQIPDSLGRKKSTIGGFTLCMTVLTVIMLVPDYKVRLISFFFLGFSNIKDIAGPIWVAESVGTDENDKARAYTITNVFDASPVLVVYVYILLGGN